MKKVSTLEKIAKVLMYIFIPAALLAVLIGGDFMPLPYKPRTRVIAGLIVGGLAGLGFGIKRKFD